MIDKSEEWLLRCRLINNKYEKLIKGWCEGDRVECGGERERQRGLFANVKRLEGVGVGGSKNLGFVC